MKRKLPYPDPQAVYQVRRYRGGGCNSAGDFRVALIGPGDEVLSRSAWFSPQLRILCDRLNRAFDLGRLVEFAESSVAFNRVWRVRSRLPERFGQSCRVLVRGRLNSCLVEFWDGELIVTSRNYLRRAAAGVQESANPRRRLSL